MKTWLAAILLLLHLCLLQNATSAAMPPQSPAVVRPLDGDAWVIAIDPDNQGRDRGWPAAPPSDAQPTRVPWIIQDAFPGYHGVAWYWHTLQAPANPHAGGRYLLRFWAVDYKADVWLNGKPVGSHAGGESPFVFDVTDVIRAQTNNLLAVCVVNPTHKAIDGIVLNEIPHRNKALPYSAGSAWDQGGIVDSVELMVVPSLRIDDLQVRPDSKTGLLRVTASIHNSASTPVQGQVFLSVSPAASGVTFQASNQPANFPPGNLLIQSDIQVPDHRLWQLNDPFLYRVAARVAADGSSSFDESSVRCGFRDFRFEDGYFRLNGRRLFLRSSHTGNCTPIGLELPHDPDLLRRDLLNVKVMGFNCIRWISGVAKRYQLDLCDEVGLLVYEEAYASWCLADSPAMAERYDESILSMVRRDRNHPSVVIWGLLNETPDGAVFRHARSALPKVLAVDDTRMVLLNSGAWHDSGNTALAGLVFWQRPGGPDPNVTFNPLRRPLAAPWATWEPGMMAFHPGPANEFSVVRWTAPKPEEIEITARFFGSANKPTTDIHILHNGRSLFDGWLNLHDGANSNAFSGRLSVAASDHVDFVLGPGNANYGGDTTALEALVHGQDGATYSPTQAFHLTGRPDSSWSFGWLAPGSRPDPATFRPYSVIETNASRAIGVLCNPGSTNWEDVISDQHPYQRTPHNRDIVHRLRTMGGGRNPLFVSEYGVGSAVDLWRTVRHYERLGATNAEDGRFYREKLDRFLADWQAWKMDAVFGRPEDFFAASLRKMAPERLLGTSALRANPNVVGYSLTGTVDQGMTGEGLFTTWRELKPGTLDAMFEAWAPLRWCLFAEPLNVYRGGTVQCDAVLANEDQLAPGDYPATIQVFGPHNELEWQREMTVKIPSARNNSEPPFAIPVLSEPVTIKGAAGRYRLVARLNRGAAPMDTEAVFHVADRGALPRLEHEVALWGNDTVVSNWCFQRGLRTHPFQTPQKGREVILAGLIPPAAGPASFADLARQVARGSTVICLAPELFASGNNAGRWLPLPRKGARKDIGSWLYHKDEWARPHPVFDGLPVGMMDYVFYRDLIPDAVWVLPDPPELVLAGANNASQDYSSGLLLASYPCEAGRFVINALRLRENLGTHPAADRLLLNLLRWAGTETGKPLADLPADFPKKLAAIGYAD